MHKMWIFARLIYALSLFLSLFFQPSGGARCPQGGCFSRFQRILRDAEVVGSNPVASTTWQGQLETLILSAFPVLFLREAAK